MRGDFYEYHTPSTDQTLIDVIIQFKNKRDFIMRSTHDRSTKWADIIECGVVKENH